MFLNGSTHLKSLFLGQLAFLSLKFVTAMVLAIGMWFPKSCVSKGDIMCKKNSVKSIHSLHISICSSNETCSIY